MTPTYAATLRSGPVPAGAWGRRAGLGAGSRPAGRRRPRGRGHRYLSGSDSVPGMSRPARVAVIGGGISGAACLAALVQKGVDAELFDRAHAPGGRMASAALHGRPVDLGAAYFTVRDDTFALIADRWRSRGLARPWTSTLGVFGADGATSSAGAQRWAAGDGLGSLVRGLLAAVAASATRVHQGTPIENLRDLDHDAVVLAMPDPQAARLTGELVGWVPYEPVIAVAAGFDARGWSMRDAAFVNDDPDITLVADDGARRGDGAPVLVIHTTATLARAAIDDPPAAVAPAVAAARRTLSIDSVPIWTHAHRWRFAKPGATHVADAFGLVEHAGRPVGLCGDSWCPQGAPRVEAAWLSGTRLGAELAERLA